MFGEIVKLANGNIKRPDLRRQAFMQQVSGHSDLERYESWIRHFEHQLNALELISIDKLGPGELFSDGFFKRLRVNLEHKAVQRSSSETIVSSTINNDDRRRSDARSLLRLLASIIRATYSTPRSLQVVTQQVMASGLTWPSVIDEIFFISTFSYHSRR
jgi:hypothetical protein